MNKTTIYFIRHGDVENPKQILYGRLKGFPLSVSGRKQADEIKRKFKNKNIACVYSSPLIRATETASPLARAVSKKVTTTNLLLETKSTLEGMPLTRYKELEPKFHDVWHKSGEKEPVRKVLLRMRRFVIRVLKENSGKNVVAVSHAGPIGILRAFYEDNDFNWDYYSKTVLKRAAFWKLVLRS